MTTNKTMAEKFEGFFGLFEPKSIEMSLNHFLHKPSDKSYTINNDRQKVELTFPDGSIFAHVEKLR